MLENILSEQRIFGSKLDRVSSQKISKKINYILEGQVMSKLTINTFDKSKIAEYKQYNELEIKSWGNITDCCELFNGCTNLQSIELPKFWGNVTDCYGMFKGCTDLHSISMPDNFGSVTDCCQMFSGCTNLQSIELPKSWENVTDCRNMFYGCTKIQSVAFPKLLKDWGVAKDCYNMFAGCTSLTKVWLPDNFGKGCKSGLGMFDGCKEVKVHIGAEEKPFPNSWKWDECKNIKVINLTEQTIADVFNFS